MACIVYKGNTYNHTQFKKLLKDGELHSLVNANGGLKAILENDLLTLKEMKQQIGTDASNYVFLTKRIQQIDERVRGYNQRISPTYEKDLRFLMEMALIGDHYALMDDLYGLDQGTDADKWNLDKQVHNIQFATGIPFDTLIGLIEKSQSGKSNERAEVKNTIRSYNSENGKKERVEYSKTLKEKANENSDRFAMGWASTKMPLNDGKKITYNDGIHYVTDILTSIFERPDLLAYVQNLWRIQQVYKDGFVTNNLLISDKYISFTNAAGNEVSFIDWFAEKQGYDFFYEDQYNELKRQTEYFAIRKFLFSSAPSVNWHSNWRKHFSGSLIEGHPTTDLTTARGVNQLIRDFPESFMSRREELIADPKYADNLFLQNLTTHTIGDITYLVFDDPYTLSDERMRDIVSDYEALPGKDKARIAYYQIAKDGWDYSKGNFAKIVIGEVMKRYSSFTDDLSVMLNTAREGKEKLANDPNYKPDVFEVYAMNKMDDVKREMQNQWASYLRNNVDLNLNRSEGTESQIPKRRTNYTVKPIVISDENAKRKKKFHVLQQGSGLSAKYSRYLYPNVGIVYDGTDNAIVYNPAITDNNARINGDKDLEAAVGGDLTSHMIERSLTNNERKQQYSIVKNKKWGQEISKHSIEKSPFRKGDIVHFSATGLAGEITQESKWDAKRSRWTYKYAIHDVMENKLSFDKVNLGNYETKGRRGLIDQLSNADAQHTMMEMVRHFNLLFPNITVIPIDFTNAIAREHSDSSSFVKNGIVYINMDMVTPDVMMEEFQHVWNAILDNTPEGKLLIDRIVNDLGDSEFGKHIADKYGTQKGTPLFRQELVANLIRYRWSQRFTEERAEEKKFKMMRGEEEGEPKKKRNERRKLWERIRVAYNEIWKEIRNMLAGLFKSTEEKANYVMRIDHIDLATTSVMDIADAMINTYLSGNKTISAMTSAQLADLEHMPYLLKSLVDVPVSNIKNIFLPKHPREDIRANKRKKITESVLQEFEKQTHDMFQDKNVYTSPYTGAVYEISKNEWSDQSKLIELINRHITNHEIDYADEGYRAELMTKFLSRIGYGKGAPILTVALDTIRSMYSDPYWEAKMNNSRIINHSVIERDLVRMVNYFSFNPMTDTAIRSTDTNGLSKYGITIPQAFQSNETIIMIHDVNEKEQAFSIFQLGEKHPNESRGRKIDANLSFKVDGLSLKQTSEDVYTLTSAIQAMGLKKHNPEISIRNVGNIGLFGMYTRSQVGFDWKVESMHHMLDQIDKLLQNGELINAFHSDVRDVLNDKQLYQDIIYDQPPLTALLSLARSVVSNPDGWEEVEIGLYGNIIADTEAYLKNQHEHKYPRKIKANIARRLEHMELTEFKGMREELIEDREYQTLVGVYTYLDNYSTIVRTEMGDMHTLKKIFMMGERLDTPLEQYIYRELVKAQQIIGQEYQEYHKEHTKQLLEVEKSIRANVNPTFKLGYTLLDNSDEIFGGMWRRSKKIGDDGQEMDYANGDIHFDINDPQTLAAVNDPSNPLTKQKVMYGKWLDEKIDDYFFQSIFYEEGYMLDGKTEAEKKESAMRELRRRRRPGQMPIMGDRFVKVLGDSIKNMKSEGFNVNQREKFMDALGRTLAKHGGIFDEAYDNQQTQLGTEDRLSNRWLNQFPRDAYGQLELNPIRQNLLGISIKPDTDGNWIYRWDTLGNESDITVQRENQRKSKIRNESIRNNLEDVMNFVAMGSIRSVIFDQRLMRKVKNYYGIREFAGKIQKKNPTAKDYIDIIKKMVQHVVFGELDEMRGNVPIPFTDIKIDLNKATVFAMLGRSLSAMGFNPRFAAKNIVGLSLNIWARSWANKVSENGHFTSDDWYKAISTFADTKGKKKIEALNLFFRVSNTDERALLSHSMNSVTRKSGLDEDVAYLGIFYGDHYSRMMIMAAQLIKEGRFDAYYLDDNLDLKYDITKDRKFSDENGNLTEEGKFMKEEMKRLIIGDGDMYSEQQLKSDRLVVGHDLRSRLPYRAITDRYLGALNQSAVSYMQRSLFGRSVVQFMTFLFPKVWNFFDIHKKTPTMGEYVYEKGVDGKQSMKWEEQEIEGLLATLIKSAQLYRKHGFAGAYQNLTPWQKSNLAAATANLSIYIGGTAMVMLLKNMLDPDDDNAAVDYIVEDIVGGGISEQKVEFWVLDEVYQRTEGLIPSVNWGGQGIQSITHLMFINDPKYVKALISGDIEKYLTEEGLMDHGAAALYKFSLWAPGGSMGRDFSDLFKQYLKYNRDDIT